MLLGFYATMPGRLRACWPLAALVAVLLLLGGARVAAQELEARPDTVLGQLGIREISSDHTGFAWVAARQGLFRYDGRQLLAVNQLARTNVRLTGEAYCVVVDSAGTVWAGMHDGLYAFVPATGGLRKIALPPLRAGNPFVSALLLHRGQLWIGRGLDPLQLLCLPVRKPLQPVRLAWQYPKGYALGFGLDSLGCPLFISSIHAWRLNASGHLTPLVGYRPGHRLTKAGGSRLRVAGATRLPLPHGHLALGDSALYEQRPGKAPRVMARWRFPRWRTPAVPHNDVLELDSTWYWPGEGEVLALSIRRSALAPVIRHYPLPHGRGWDLQLRFNRDRTGFWAYDAGVAGAMQLRPRRVPAVALPVAGGQVLSTRSINRLPDGRLLVGSYAGTFTQAADSPAAPLRRWPGITYAYTWFSTLRLPGSRLLIANEFGGFQVLDGPRMDAICWELPHPNPTAQSSFCLLRDRAGQLWGGGQAGLFQLDADQLTRVRYREKDAAWPLHRCEIEALAEGQPGELWLATNRGLYRLRPATGELRHYGPNEPAPYYLPTSSVRCVLPTSADSVWVGTLDAGLLLLHPRQGVQRQLTLHKGLPSEAVAFLVAPAPGRVLWVGTYKGLVRYELATGRRSDLTTSDGLATNEMNRQSVWFEAASRQLYVGGVGGVSRLAPAALDYREPQPRLLLTAITQHHAEGDVIQTAYLNGALAAGLTLAPGDAFADLQLSLSDYNRPNQARFAYRLLGSPNAHWQELGTSARLRLQRLETGRYTLEIRAETEMGTPARNVLRVPVRVYIYWWRQPLVWALLAVGLAALSGGAAYGWQRRRAAQREARQQADFETRRRLAADLHDEVGALLTRVTMRAEMLEEEQNSPQLAALLQESRTAAATVRDIIWSVNVAADTVEALSDRFRDLLDQTTHATNRATTYTLNAPEPEARLRPEVRQHTYLIGKEAVTNALKHSSCGELLTLALHVCATELRLEIGNGGHVGPASRTGQGLRNMASRAAAIGAELAAGPAAGGGWRVALWVPRPLAEGS